MKYIKSLDGLRAIAVLPIIFYHLNPKWIESGYLGVDVFFVISGFLISTIILKKLEENKFSFSNFYSRRIKRLMPAYFITICVSYFISFFLLLPNELKTFNESIVSSLLYFSNYYFLVKLDYFNPFAEYSPLIHTWSLSIEEQFYLFLPILLFAFRRKRRFLVFTLWLLLSLSLGYYLFLFETNVSQSYYSSASRFWQLLSGVLLGYYGTNLKRFFKLLKLDFFVYSSFMLLVLSFFIPRELFQQYKPLTTVIATIILLINSSRESLLINRLLSSKLLVGIGALSYSLYLVHQPIISFTKIFLKSNNSMMEMKGYFLLVIVIFGVSKVLYRYVEYPLKTIHSDFKTTFKYQIYLSTIFISLGFIGYYSNGFQSFYARKYGIISTNQSKAKRDSLRTTLKLGYNNSGITSNSVIIIGDSHGEDASISLINSDHNLDLTYFKIDDTCFAEIEKDYNSGKSILKCSKFGIEIERAKFVKAIRNSKSIILSCLWTKSYEKDVFKFINFLGQLRKNEFGIYLITGASFTDINSILISLKNNSIEKAKSGKFIYNNFRNLEVASINENLKELLSKKINIIQKEDFFCPNANSCDLFDDLGNPLIWDDSHLTIIGFERFSSFIKNHLKAK